MEFPVGTGARRWLGAVVFASVFGVVASGCQAPLRARISEKKAMRSGDYLLIRGLDVPPAPGPSGCGAQSMAAILAYHDKSLNSQEEADKLPWKDRGATPVAILLSARGLGYEATVLRGTWDDLERAVERDEPVLVMFDRGRDWIWPLGSKDRKPLYHWGVVSGMALKGDKILLAAPDHDHYVVGRKLFEGRWDAADRCTITLRPSGEKSLTTGNAESTENE